VVKAEDVGVPDVIGEPRRVRQQMTQRDRATGLPQAGSPGVVEPFENLDRGQLRHMGAQRFVKFDPILLDELHRRDGGHGFGHGVKCDHRVEGHRPVLANRTFAECPRVDNTGVVGCERDDSGDRSRVDGMHEDLVHVACDDHGSLLADASLRGRDQLFSYVMWAVQYRAGAGAARAVARHVRPASRSLCRLVSQPSADGCVSGGTANSLMSAPAPDSGGPE
jgi:hypothetical protein